MNDLMNENRLSFAEAARREKVHTTTIRRWWQKGIRGIFLETFVIGGRRYTTEEALQRFHSRLNGHESDDDPPQGVPQDPDPDPPSGPLEGAAQVVPQAPYAPSEPLEPERQEQVEAEPDDKAA
jgi:hypothetical protein